MNISRNNIRRTFLKNIASIILSRCAKAGHIKTVTYDSFKDREDFQLAHKIIILTKLKLENLKAHHHYYCFINPSILDNNLKVGNDKNMGLSGPASEYQTGINSI